MTRILFAGWRRAQAVHRDIIAAALSRAETLAGLIRIDSEGHQGLVLAGFTLVYAEMSGANKLAATVAVDRGWSVEPHVGPWVPGSLGAKLRTRHVVSLGAGLLVGAPGSGSTFTWQWLRVAAEFGIPAHVQPLTVHEGPRRQLAAANVQADQVASSRRSHHPILDDDNASRRRMVIGSGARLTSERRDAVEGTW